MIYEKISREVKNIFSKKNEIIVAYLYGSSLTSRECNDIDLGLLVENNFQPGTLYEAKLAGDLEKILKKYHEISLPVDLRILNHCSLRFNQSILKKAKIIFSKDEMKRIEFETSILNQYLDMKPHYDYYDRMRRIRYANKY